MIIKVEDPIKEKQASQPKLFEMTGKYEIMKLYNSFSYWLRVSRRIQPKKLTQSFEDVCSRTYGKGYEAATSGSISRFLILRS